MKTEDEEEGEIGQTRTRQLASTPMCGKISRAVVTREKTLARKKRSLKKCFVFLALPISLKRKAGSKSFARRTSVKLKRRNTHSRESIHSSLSRARELTLWLREEQNRSLTHGSRKRSATAVGARSAGKVCAQTPTQKSHGSCQQPPH